MRQIVAALQHFCDIHKCRARRVRPSDFRGQLARCTKTEKGSHAKNGEIFVLTNSFQPAIH
jgi:hypothetical protein